MLDLLELSPESQLDDRPDDTPFTELMEAGGLTPDQIVIACALKVLQARIDLAELEAAAVYN